MDSESLYKFNGTWFAVKIIEDQPDGNRYEKTYQVIKIEEVDNNLIRITNRDGKTEDIPHDDLSYIAEILIIKKGK